MHVGLLDFLEPSKLFAESPIYKPFCVYIYIYLYTHTHTYVCVYIYFSLHANVSRLMAYQESHRK